jgi:predicted PurR-regulated permease PerM
MSLSSTEPQQPAEPAPAELVTDSSRFVRRLLVATLSLLLLVLTVHLLEKFRTIFEPLFIGVFIAYLILPIHAWLVRRGMPALVAYATILLLLLLMLVGVGTLAYVNYRDVTARLPEYERRLDAKVRDALADLPVEVPEGRKLLRELPLEQYFSAQQLLGALGAAVGTFLDFFTWLAVTFVYLVFLIIEKETFPRRILRAFGEQQGKYVLDVVVSINQAIAQYISVKTLVSLIAAVASLVVLLLFGVDFAVTWALLIFLFNFIPYLGSMVATALPILLSLVQLEELWQVAVVAVLLIAIQQAIGAFLEPRIAGRRLDVSPFLILLSLAFWGMLWGIVGMILAVPMLVILRIILENIKETRPIAILISNM